MPTGGVGFAQAAAAPALAAVLIQLDALVRTSGDVSSSASR
jgi:hypothetical protein